MQRRLGRAGGFLEEEYRKGIRRYRRRVTPRLVLILLPFVVVALLLSVFGQGLWHWDGGFLLGAAVSLFIGMRQTPPAHIDNKATGALGEQRTAKTLRRLERDGWHAVHDLERRANGNVDHLLIGPRGVFILDSKLYGGATRVDDSGVLTVTPHDDSAITWTFRDHHENLQIAKRVVARALARRAHITVPQPTPVVVIWARFPQRSTVSRGVAYVAGADLVDWLLTENKGSLSRSQIAELAAAATPDLLKAVEDR
jgi:hypothetical protein